MSNHDQTSMGGEREGFLITHWSLIEDVKQHRDKDRALIGLLSKRYWKPVYCYLRRKGYNNEQAKDLTQGFLHEVVLNRRLCERAESSRGRFRSFLLHALNQYLIDEHRKENTRKHIPRDKLVPLDIADSPALPQMVCELDEEQSFNYTWKADLLERALAEVKDRYTKQGMETHWNVFQDRLLRPILEGNQSLPGPFIYLFVVHILSPPNNKLSDSRLRSIAKLNCSQQLRTLNSEANRLSWMSGSTGSCRRYLVNWASIKPG